MKRRMLAFLLLLLFALTASAGAVSLYVDTDLIQTDVPPTIVDGRTLVPMRAIFEALGAEVDWDGETRTATGTLGDHTVVIQVGETEALVDGETRHTRRSGPDHPEPHDGSRPLHLRGVWLLCHVGRHVADRPPSPTVSTANTSTSRRPVSVIISTIIATAAPILKPRWPMPWAAALPHVKNVQNEFHAKNAPDHNDLEHFCT